MNPKTLELRNLLPGQAPAGVKCCGICGKPEGRADKHVKALPHHAAAIAADLPGQFRTFTKRVAPDALIDFVMRDKFNAQLDSIRAKLLAAREEHDAYTPPVKDNASDKAKLVATLMQTLDMLGVKVRANPDAEDGAWTPLALADAVQYEVGVLLALKADAEKEKQAACQHQHAVTGLCIHCGGPPPEAGPDPDDTCEGARA